MRLTRYFLPTLKENPAEAQIVSHRLMLRAGMIRQTSAGIYAWLPLGYRVLKRVEAIVRAEQDRYTAIEMLMPTIQSADLWRESGRYEDYGKEMLRITDRHERDMLFGPTNEEMITDIFRNSVKSYRDLPKILYHIQWKFRDEVRPRFGVMRGREFLMKDAYSFDIDFLGARRSYRLMLCAYLSTFSRLGLKAIPVAADSGPIGGDMSHEFHVLAETGESQIYADPRLLDLDAIHPGPDGDIDVFFETLTGLYAAADEKHDPAKSPLSPDQLVTRRGIEVGHIFYFGTKYSKAMNATVNGPSGEQIPVEMGSYGIGVSRLIAAIIEARHHLARQRRPVRRRPDQPEIGRRRGGRGGGRHLPETDRSRRRRAVRRSRRETRRQIREYGLDRFALAADRGSARTRERSRGDQAAGNRRTVRIAHHRCPRQARGGSATRAGLLNVANTR